MVISTHKRYCHNNSDNLSYFCVSKHCFRLSFKAKQQWVASLIDLREGIGLPVVIEDKIIYHPDRLLQYLDHHFSSNETPIKLNSLQAEPAVLLEAYIEGREFSCMVLEATPGQPLALLPTEIMKGDVFFDYRAKYLPGIVHKETPMRLAIEHIQAIRESCAALFHTLNLNCMTMQVF